MFSSISQNWLRNFENLYSEHKDKEREIKAHYLNDFYDHLIILYEHFNN